LLAGYRSECPAPPPPGMPIARAMEEDGPPQLPAADGLAYCSPVPPRMTSFCISLALLRRMEARNLENDPLRRVRPPRDHFFFVFVCLIQFSYFSNEIPDRIVEVEVLFI
jgi:hypothetical protein